MAKNETESIKLNFTSRLQYLDLVYKAINEISHLFGLSDKKTRHLSIAASEAVTNAILYGNCEDANKHVHVELKVFSDRIVVVVEDEGEKAFQYDSQVHGNIENKGHFDEKGRGIFIMKMYVDKLDYGRSSPGGTRVSLTKYF